MACKLAIVGANSAVGEVLLQLLADRQLAFDELHILAPDPHDEEEVRFKRKTLRCEALADFDFGGVDIVFFVDDRDLAADYAGPAADAGAYVVDCSPHFRDAEDVPLVVPEVNGEILDNVERGTLIASPAPSSILLALVLKPLMATAKLTRVAVSSLEPVSTQGKAGVDELAGQTARLLNGMPAGATVFPQQVAFNLLPQTSDLSPEGYSAEELDLLHQTRRLLGEPGFSLNPTCIQAPVFYAHSEIISIEAEQALTVADVTAALSRAPGIKLARPGKGGPSAVQDATGQDVVMVGRIRQSMDNEREINLWCVGDNLRKGAALNAVQIAEILIKTHL